MISVDARHPHDVDAQATHWFARLLAPDCTESERSEFAAWRRRPEHARAYAEVESLWRCFESPVLKEDPRVRGHADEAWDATAQAGAGGAAGTGIDADSCVGAGTGVGTRGVTDLELTLSTLPPRPRASSSSRPRRKQRLAMGLAATVMAAAVGFGVYRHYTAAPPETLHASTTALREVALPDGSRAWLDVDTELAVRYGRGRRDVALHHGRALFQVAPDPQRPFHLDLGDTEVTVLGTRFQSARDGERVSVTLDEGALRLDLRGERQVRGERLSPGEQISYDARRPADWTRRRVDSAAAIAWSRGRLIFRSLPLEEAVREVNRYAAHPQLRVADDALRDLPVSGNFLAGDSELVAAAWAATLPVHIERHDGSLLIMSAAAQTKRR